MSSSPTYHKVAKQIELTDFEPSILSDLIHSFKW
jgi:hypothetical protein